MNSKTFEKEAQALIDECWNTLFNKAKEYANDKDRLANFKQPTSLFGVNQAEVCLFYDTKHIASMVKMAKDANNGELPTKEFLIEKVGDYINYGILFYANMLELMNKKSES